MFKPAYTQPSFEELLDHYQHKKNEHLVKYHPLYYESTLSFEDHTLVSLIVDMIYTFKDDVQMAAHNLVHLHLKEEGNAHVSDLVIKSIFYVLF